MLALYCHFAFFTLCVIFCRVAQYVGENIEPAISIYHTFGTVSAWCKVYLYI